MELFNQIVKNLKAVFLLPEEATNVEVAAKLEEFAEKKTAENSAFETVMNDLVGKITESINAKESPVKEQLTAIAADNENLRNQINEQLKTIESLQTELKELKTSNDNSLEAFKKQVATELNTIKGIKTEPIAGDGKVIETQGKTIGSVGVMSIKDLRNL